MLKGLSEGDTNGDGIVDVKGLGDSARGKVPELTSLWWGLSQAVRHELRVSSEIVGAPGGGDQRQPAGRPDISNSHPDRTEAARQFGNGAAIDIVNLDAGAKVRVVQTKGEWDLIARDGKIIGYVEADKLKAVEGNVSVK